MSEENAQAPGWYTHPDRPEEEWYWGGDAWTESRWATKLETSATEPEARKNGEDSPSRQARRLAWVGVLLVAAAVALVNTSELAADLLGLVAGLAWFGCGVLRWQLAAMPEGADMCLSASRGWRIPTRYVAVFYLLIGLSVVIVNIVRIAQST
jgi:hypothetical protein